MIKRRDGKCPCYNENFSLRAVASRYTIFKVRHTQQTVKRMYFNVAYIHIVARSQKATFLLVRPVGSHRRIMNEHIFHIGNYNYSLT